MDRQERINDIFYNEKSKNNLVVDLESFFEHSTLKAIRLNQSNLFSDIYIELKEKIDLSKKQFLKISSLKEDITKDVFKKIEPKLSISNIITRKKPRMLADTINILQPVIATERNTLDIRQMEIIPCDKTYPDFYILPLLPRQKIKKFYKESNEAIKTIYDENNAAIKKLYEDNNEVIKKGLSKGLKYTILIGIIFTSLILSLIGYKNYLQTEVTNAYTSLYSLKSIKNPQELKDKAREIRSKFRILSIIFTPTRLIGDNFIYSNKKINMAKNAISGGEKIANIAYIGGSIWYDFNNEIQAIQKNKKTEDTLSYNFLSNFKFTEFFKKEEENIKLINSDLKSSIKSYSQIGDLGKAELNDKLSQALEGLIKLQKSLNYTLDNRNVLLKALGDSTPVRYFILNQNKDELRANGGFPGSVITLELYKGSVLNYDKKDIYYYDWHLAPYKESSPEGINVISPTGGLRDANYMPIFKDSFEKINFFYEKGGGGSIDTIIGINQGLVEDILKKYGPVHLDVINTDITADNFSTIMSVLVENKFQKVVSPKDILFKFSEALEKKLIEKKDLIGYFDIFMNNISAGEILVASRDSDIQKFIDGQGIIEKWKNETGNWFYPVFTSIGLNKSDRYMNRDFKMISNDRGNCEIANSITITSKHNFNDTKKGEIMKILSDFKITDTKEIDRLTGIQGNGINRQFIRVLTPKGSSLINSNNTSISVDNSNPNYTFFKLYLNTDIGKTNEVKFDYLSKPKNCKANPIYYKQPGLSNYTFTQD